MEAFAVVDIQNLDQPLFGLRCVQARECVRGGKHELKRELDVCPRNDSGPMQCEVLPRAVERSKCQREWFGRAARRKDRIEQPLELDPELLSRASAHGRNAQMGLRRPTLQAR